MVRKPATPAAAPSAPSIAEAAQGSADHRPNDILGKTPVRDRNRSREHRDDRNDVSTLADCMHLNLPWRARP